MIRDRLTQLMVHLTDNTVLGELLTPMRHALAAVRGAASLGRVLSMEDFIALGVLRHLRGMTTLREQVQALLHLDPAQAAHVPLPRSTWSDALSAGSRLMVLKETLTVLNAEASATLPDRLAGIPGLGRARWVPSTELTSARARTFAAARPSRAARTTPRATLC